MGVGQKNLPGSNPRIPWGYFSGFLSQIVTTGAGTAAIERLGSRPRVLFAIVPIPYPILSSSGGCSVPLCLDQKLLC